MKLNLGCGADVRPGFVNVDSVELPGVDVVHDLGNFPWPFGDQTADEVLLIHVAEHMPDLVALVEELHRVCRPGGIVRIRVPYYNSPDMLADPTHKRFISERTFNFFDPSRSECQERPYYSSARFAVSIPRVYVKAFGVYAPVGFGPLKRALLWVANRIGAIVWVIDVELTSIR